MMADDILFEHLVKCPVCQNTCQYGAMIWLNGQATCPTCYEKKRAKLDELMHGDTTQGDDYV